MPDLPPELLEALERGTITRAQLLELIALEAQGLGLTVTEAQEKARTGKLPKSALGLDLASLIELLEVTPSAA